MIELLIVISVLGILAAGVLAAVDPFEQLKKARDTNNRQSVISLQTALIRYYATHGQLPWDNTAVAGTTCGSATGANALFGAARVTPVALNDGRMGDVTTPGDTCVGLLESEGELKAGFVGAIGAGIASTIYTLSTAPALVSVCYPPTSKSIFAEDNTKFDKSGTDLSATTCAASAKAASTVKASDSPPSCYYCAQ